MLDIVDREKEEAINTAINTCKFNDYITIEVRHFQNILDGIYEKGRKEGIREGMTDSFYLVDAHKLSEPGVIDTRIIHSNGTINRIKDSLRIKLKDLPND